MENRFFVKPTTDDQIAAFVKEWQRNALLEQKAECLSRGKTIREIMVEDGDWDYFCESAQEFGEEPEEACESLQKLIDEVV